MHTQNHQKPALRRVGMMLAATGLTIAVTAAAQQDRRILVITSTNNSSANAAVVFKLDTAGTPSLSLQATLPTGGQGGASGNAGILQFENELGAVANYGSNTVSQLVRENNSITLGKTIGLASDCVKPDSVALTLGHLYVVGANCAESHSWPWGNIDGPVVDLTDPSAAQIAVGNTWAAVTMTSGSVLQLPLNSDGALNGTSTAVSLPSDANNTPLGEAFWGNTLGFTPAHSPDSFAIVNESGTVYPMAGPTPSYPNGNAPCWVAKGPLSVWYTGNSPGDAISEFFSDSQGGAFYKSVSLPGSPTDITVSPDRKWLAVIYSSGGEAYVAVFSINGHGDLTHVATSNPIGVASFNGVAISQ